ncbi:hypothetical protein LAG90_09355 [Marinilongibacter aquaticus]|uniref:hypothetical protein n=1 Tax=Marinilongibacter aquaticus TaxID=2975157 RepID=UPI0021BD2C36|nr:hypothetical protein [Marinilongibacter aquaticus]UBM60840.1 hypothetical protein LAG90_09355 [Marinilongibacter aquaticus]
MKTILTTVFACVSLLTFAQKEIDENGRPVGSKPNMALATVEKEPLIKSEGTTAADVNLEYNLPNGSQSGKLVIYHPSADKELKTYPLSAGSGTLAINGKEIGLDVFVVALYDDKNKFVKELRIAL